MRSCQGHDKLYIKMIKDKRGQEQKSRILEAKHKNAQEEIVGFSMIIVIVAVILIIFLSLSLKNPQKDTVESYEVESYLQSLLQKTTDCRSMDNLRNYSIKDVMFRCYGNETCLDNRKMCDVLVRELGVTSNQSWDISRDSPVKGYTLDLTVNGEQLKTLGYGNVTRSSKGASQELTRNSNMFNLEFKVYY